jgi:hypothetical protein
MTCHQRGSSLISDILPSADVGHCRATDVDSSPPRGADIDVVTFPPGPAKRPYPTWGIVAISLCGVLALLAWLATAGVVVVAMAPSGSTGEALGIGLLQYTLLPAYVLTATTLLIAGVCARSPTTKAIAFVLGAAMTIMVCLTLASPYHP